MCTDSQRQNNIQHLHEGAIASLSNARQFVEAAELVRDHNGPPRIAFHLATLAIEEVGKSELLGMGAMALRMVLPDTRESSRSERDAHAHGR